MVVSIIGFFAFLAAILINMCKQLKRNEQEEKEIAEKANKWQWISSYSTLVLPGFFYFTYHIHIVEFVYTTNSFSFIEDTKK